MELLKSQKVELHRLIGAVGLRPADFALAERLSITGIGSCPAVFARGTDFYFAFDSNGLDSVLVLCPGQENKVEQYRYRGWAEAAGYFANWLAFLHREMNATDPWEEIERQTISFGLSFDDNTPASPFTVPEHKKVMQTLSVIQGLLITYAKENGAKHDRILEGIKRLEDAAERQDRKSWFQLAVGYIISTATAMGLDHGKTKALFVAFKNGLEGVIVLFLKNSS